MPSSSAARIGALALCALLAGCVEQEQGLLIAVEVAVHDLPGEPVATLAGPMPMADARLRVEQLALEPCPEATAGGPLRWLIGAARAHGGAAHGDGALIVDLGAELGAGETVSGAVEVPPEHSICAVELRFAPSDSAELTVLVDGEPRRWAPPLPATRWTIPPLALDRRRRGATVYIETSPARWLAPFEAGGGGDREAPLAEQLAAGVTRSLTVSVR